MTGKELKKLRKSLGLSLAQASRQVEVSSRTFARWESGVQVIPAGSVKLFLLLNKSS
jgi:DNA-binding transcriptional regulator YiaG